MYIINAIGARKNQIDFVKSTSNMCTGGFSGVNIEYRGGALQTRTENTTKLSRVKIPKVYEFELMLHNHFG